MKQPSHSKIEFLSEVKSEIFVLEGLRGKFDKSDLTFDRETSTRVVDLLTRQNVSQGVTVTPGGNGFFAYPYMLRRSMVFGDQDLEGFKAKLVTFVRTAQR